MTAPILPDHAGPTLVGYVFVPGRLWTVNDERAKHWRYRAGMTADWREVGALAWIAAGCTADAELPPLLQVMVRPHQRRGGRLADLGAHLPPAKAVVDGLVDAGAIPDDDPRYVARLTFLPAVWADERGEGLEVALHRTTPT